MSRWGSCRSAGRSHLQRYGVVVDKVVPVDVMCRCPPRPKRCVRPERRRTRLQGRHGLRTERVIMWGQVERLWGDRACKLARNRLLDLVKDVGYVIHATARLHVHVSAEGGRRTPRFRGVLRLRRAPTGARPASSRPVRESVKDDMIASRATGSGLRSRAGLLDLQFVALQLCGSAPRSVPPSHQSSIRAKTRMGSTAAIPKLRVARCTTAWIEPTHTDAATLFRISTLFSFPKARGVR